MVLRRSIFFLVTGIITMLMSVGTASAHSQLVASDPADGSVLSAPPTQVVLTFNEALIVEAADVAIVNGSGEAVSGAVATPVGAIVTIQWPADLPPDNYSVSYRIVSDDGHPITGSIGFSYTSASSSPPVVTPEATPVATPEASSNSGPATGFPIGIVGLILALAATITVIILARRARR